MPDLREELRSRCFWLLNQRGKTTLNGVSRAVTIENIGIKLVAGTHLTVAAHTRTSPSITFLLYDSERPPEYHNLHTICWVVLPLLRKEMVLDDLSRI